MNKALGKVTIIQNKQKSDEEITFWLEVLMYQKMSDKGIYVYVDGKLNDFLIVLKYQNCDTAKCFKLKIVCYIEINLS